MSYCHCVTLCHIVTPCHRSQYHTLYSDDKKFKEYLEMCQVLFDLLAIVEQPDADTEVLGEAFAAITCLTDNGMSLLPHSSWDCSVYTLVQRSYVRKHVNSTFTLKC